MMESWGFKIKIGSSIGKKDFTFGGTNQERISDFQQMVDDENIKAIMCARGGYDIVRILDKLDFQPLQKNQNGLSALAMQRFCTAILIKIFLWLLSIQKCATAL